MGTSDVAIAEKRGSMMSSMPSHVVWSGGWIASLYVAVWYNTNSYRYESQPNDVAENGPAVSIPFNTTSMHEGFVLGLHPAK